MHGARFFYFCAFILLFKHLIIMGKFKELRVWNDAMDLTVKIYEITRELPFKQDFGLCNQLRRAAVSINSSIAEGDESG